MREPDVATDHTATTDHCVTTENCRVCVNSDIVFDGRMTLHIGQLLVHSQRTKRHTLIQAHVVADARSFANDDTRTMIDRESFADRGTGVQIDAGSLMCPLSDQSRNDRHAAMPEWLRHAVTDSGQKPRIREKHLVDALGGGIHLMQCLGIGVQTDADVRQRRHQGVGIGCCVSALRPQFAQQFLQRRRHTVVLGADPDVIATGPGRGGVREEKGQNAAHPGPHRLVQPSRKRIRRAGFAQLGQKSLRVMWHRRQTIRVGNPFTAGLAGPRIALVCPEYLSLARPRMSLLDESVIRARLGEFIADARFAEALALLDRCLIVGTDDSWLHGMRALLLLETGDVPAALKSSAAAVQIAPIAAFAHWARGVVLLRANILPGAQRAAERAVALDPEEPDTHVLLARVYLQHSLWELAKGAVADAELNGAEEEELMPLRAAIASGRGLDERARDTWRAFAHRYPANALARTGNAWTMLESGDVSGARDEFEQARELDPTNAWAIEGLVITSTKLLPIHRRWFAVVWGRVMRRREETMLIAGAALTSVAVVLLGSGRTGIVLPMALTAFGAALPMLDAWRQGKH